jgi:hypothetical protein
MNEFKELLGITLASVTGKKGDSEIVFELNDGRKFKLYHNQDCCEHVYVEDVCGELSDLVDSPIIQAEENSSQDNPEGYISEDYQDSFTWTFYRIATAKGQVVIRFYGSSNGYYSESVDFCQLT